jgi:hypothetical protein
MGNYRRWCAGFLFGGATLTPAEAARRGENLDILPYSFGVSLPGSSLQYFVA